MSTIAAASTDRAAQLQRWGGSEALDDFETLMWRLDDRPNLRSAVVSVEILDRVPDWERLWTAHEWAAAATPRMRSRLLELPPGLGNPVWKIDRDFRLDRHLRRIQLRAPGELREVLDHAQRLAMAPFDKRRPPWEALLIEGLQDGGAAYVLKLHHAMSDGMGIVQLLGAAHSRSREPQPRPQAATPQQQRLGETLSRQLLRRRENLAARLQDARRGVETLLTRGRDDAGQLAIDALRYAASLKRVLDPKSAPPSPLLARRSHRWRFEAMEVPLAGLKAAAKQSGATLNDAFIAGLLGGFARYHRRFGTVPSSLPVTFPISLRSAQDSAGGNRFVPGQFAAPLAEPDPRKRMQLISEAVTRIRREPALRATLDLMPLLSRLPTAVVAEAMGRRIASQDLQISNVPGLRDEVYLAGARVTQLFPFAPLPGCAGMITLVSHGDSCCIGLNLDEAAVSRPGWLMQDLQESFDEVLRLGTAAEAAHA
ncbi:MAG TPA: wax ester/triacylglycerol synthase domain-containing protein [Solimonas sp.]|nr:wax ester/triacylglycerol synthase domain-containing protein [Solimonas sp.]